jgi:hypothetical protein
MKKFLLEAIVYPFVAIAFCSVFGGFFVYAGFQTAHVELTRSPEGAISGHITRTQFFGVLVTEEEVTGVEGATIETRQYHRTTGRFRRIGLGSGAAILSEEGVVPVFAGFSTVDDALKREIVASISDFVDDRTQAAYTETFRIRNIFGWVGLPFFALGVLGLLNWPFSIITYLRKNA